jgi:hypothetical protein
MHPSTHALATCCFLKSSWDFLDFDSQNLQKWPQVYNIILISRNIMHLFILLSCLVAAIAAQSAPAAQSTPAASSTSSALAKCAPAADLLPPCAVRSLHISRFGIYLTSIQRKCINDVGATKGCKERDIKCLCQKNDELMEPGAACVIEKCPGVTPMMVTEITFSICDCMVTEGGA